MKKFSLNFLVFSLVNFILSGCEIAKRPSDAPPLGGTIINAIESEQSAISDQYWFNQELRIRDIFSTIQSKMYLSTNEASYKKRFSPEMGCFRAQNAPAANAPVTRMLDPGEMYILDSTGAGATITKYVDLTFFTRGLFLPMGDYRMKTSGINGALALDQSFKVTGPGGNISVSSGTYSNQVLPSPLIDASISIRFQRSAGANISFTAPDDTDFVKLELNDADTPDSNLVCYGAKDETIQIPADLLERFGVSDRGLLTLKFVKTYLDKGIPRINESFISSSVYHMHGTKIIGTNLFQFGTVSFE